MKEIYSKLAAAIVSDNKKEFDKLISTDKERLNVCFGRFPLLSACYLVGANKIAAAYERKLLPLFKFEDVGEYCDFEKVFLKKAKKSISFYIDGTKLTPLEALAITNDSAKLKKVYPTAFKSRSTQERIEKIFLQKDGRTVQCKVDEVIIPRARLRLSQIKFIAAVLSFCVLSIVCSGTILGVANNVFGSGSQSNPYKIKTENQLIDAASRKAYAVLTEDIVLTKWEAIALVANINGDGHTITANGRLFDTLSGSLENIVFDFGDVTNEATDNAALVALTNEGTIDKVTVKANWNITETSAAENCYIGGFVSVNKGTISACTADIRMSAVGNGVGDAYAALFVGYNEATVSDCNTLQESKLSAETIDLAGICGRNAANGKIMTSQNKAAITQITHNEQWSPNCAGITVNNLGTLENCLNYGDIKSQSTVEKMTQVVASGISAVNSGTLQKCGNNSAVEGQSSYSYVYCGGVVGINESSGIINNCSAFGTVKGSATHILAEGETAYTFVFSGGLVGYFKGGAIDDSYTATTTEAAGETAYAGGALGLINFAGSIIQAQSVDNVYYLSTDEDRTGIGAGLNTILGEIVPSMTYGKIIKLATIAEIEALEVYWK